MASVYPFTVNYLQPNRGPIYDLETGKAVGTHKGLWTYTIGEGARLKGSKDRYFVTSKSKAENAIYVVYGP
jgi:tRNA U34 2-thiouridine synthase MnmA/TrmU